MNSQTMIVDLNRELVPLTYSDAKDLFSPQLIAITPFMLLVDAKPDDATIVACVDLGLSVSAVQENADELEVYRAYIARQFALKMSVQGAQVFAVKLLGGDGATVLAFPSLAKTVLESRKQEKERREGKQSAEEGGSTKNQEVGETLAVGKEGPLLQSDIRQFSGKKAPKAKEPRSVVKDVNIPKKKVQRKDKEPKRAVGVQVEEAAKPQLEKFKEPVEESSSDESSEVRIGYRCIS